MIPSVDGVEKLALEEQRGFLPFKEVHSIILHIYVKFKLVESSI